jgi:multiple sugar transport system permease protein
MLLTSFKPEKDIVVFPPKLLPEEITIISYIDIWRRITFLRYYINTLIFAGGVTIVSLFFDSMAGYSFARINFKGRNIIFMLVLCTLMVPFQVIMTPLFFEVYKLGLLNTYMGLILPRASNAFGIFMMRQFFITLPKDLEDSARVDGCNEFRIYFSIMLPLCKPSLIALGIFHFMFNWNDLLYPLLLTSGNEMRTISSGLALFMGQHVVEYGILMAASCLSLAPILTAYLFSQKYFIKGIAMTGIKG